MTTTDLKPGDIVQHPEHGFGFIVLLKKDLGDEPASEAVVRSTNPRRNYGHDLDLDGWERVETVRPGHVQVRVDDLDPQTLSEWSQYAGCNLVETALLRVGCATIASQVEHGDPSQHWPAGSTPPADEQDASATEAATYQCPWCSTDVNFSVALNRNPRGDVMAWVEADGAHTCPPAQPDEPTEFGARIVVTLPDGTREKWLRSKVNTNEAWRAGNGSEIGWFSATTWDNVIERGTVTLGWDE